MMTTRDPVIDRSRMLVCFAAWQRAQGRRDLTQAGTAWLAFCDWWDRRDLTYFANDRQLARAAWNGSSGRFESQITNDDDRARFDVWWSKTSSIAPHSSRSASIR